MWCVSMQATGFLLPLLLAFFFVICLLCTVSCSLLGFWLRLCFCVFGAVVCFFFFLLLLLLFQLVCLDCERKKQAFVCGNWVSFAVGGLKVSRRRARGDLWGGEGM